MHIELLQREVDDLTAATSATDLLSGVHMIKTFTAFDADQGVKRQVLADSPELMVVAVRFGTPPL